MGESRRRRAAIGAANCRCGSGKLASQCCYVGGTWSRAAAPVSLKVPCHSGSNAGCYLSHLNSCDGKISREHLISKSVLDVLTITEFVVSGLPWLAKDESRAIGKESFVAKCLCRAHNSALSPLDAAAARLFEGLKRADLNRGEPRIHETVSGHDIERWLLKTLLAMAHSSNLSRDGTVMPPTFYPTLAFASMLEDPLSWPAGTGLYFAQEAGKEFDRRDQFALAPTSKEDTGEICGLQANVQGLEFKLFAVPTDDAALISTLPTFRPGRFIFKHAQVTNIVELAWQDGRSHSAFDLTFVSTLGERAAAGAQP